MAKPIYCAICDKLATHTIQPSGGTKSYWCTEHFNQAVKELSK